MPQQLVYGRPDLAATAQASDGCMRRCSVPYPRSPNLGSARSGRTPRPLLSRMPRTIRGPTTSCFEGAEDGVDEEVVDEVTAESSETP